MVRGLLFFGGGLIIGILQYIKMVEEEAGITWKNLFEKCVGGGGSCQIFTTATEIALAPIISGPLPNKNERSITQKKKVGKLPSTCQQKLGP